MRGKRAEASYSRLHANIPHRTVQPKPYNVDADGNPIPQDWTSMIVLDTEVTWALEMGQLGNIRP